MPGDSQPRSILSIGTYVPRWRISRRTITEAVGWSRGRPTAGDGSRAFANWDEDALTMAVEASRMALGPDGREPDALLLASTTLPFADRSNAGVVREALGLGAEISLGDLTGSRRAGSAALADALLRSDGPTCLICASDCVETRPGGEAEPETGHGAAAVTVGQGPGLATLRAAGRLQQDFVDRYRMASQRFDYRLEARWVRDAGTRSQFRALVAAALEDAGTSAESVSWLLLPFDASGHRVLARDTGLEHARTALEFVQEIGLCGAAQPLLMLDWALRRSAPGDNIVLVGAGQGLDVLVLEATAPPPPVVTAPARMEENYTRFLALRRVLDIDAGLRAERDNRTAQSAAWRRHEQLTGFLAGRCTACDKLQFPAAQICVHCHAQGEQTLESLADLTAEVNSFTEDWLAYSPRPPLIFGNVHFPGGANVMLEFTDFEAGELKTGQAVRMAFRVKDFDDRRNFRRYFWKPAPTLTEQTDG